VADLVLVTGAAGTLGRAVMPALLQAGYGVRAGDLRAIEGAPDGVDLVDLDLRDRDAVARAMEGVTAVLHGAAWHGIHMKEHPPSDFWELNATGTFHVLQAALDAGVRAVVLSSTMGVYGESRRADDGGPAVRIHEGLPLLPGDVYGATKVVAEELSLYFARRGISGVALRYGMFVPEPFHHAGIRFLYGGVDERDVASANLRSVKMLLEGPPGAHLGGFNIESAVPFAESDGHLLRENPLEAIAHHWPDAPALLEKAGTAPWGPINEYYDISRAEEVLGWRPQWGFSEYLTALREGREEL
jgi:nucleoside-diphosphate-sugar epimerase